MLKPSAPPPTFPILNTRPPNTISIDTRYPSPGQYQESFGFVILVSVILAAIAQLNIWRVLCVTGLRGQDVSNKVLPGLGYLVSILMWPSETLRQVRLRHSFSFRSFLLPPFHVIIAHYTKK